MCFIIFSGIVLLAIMWVPLLNHPINGHFVVVTNDIIRSLSHDFIEETPYEHTTDFPPICKHVDTNCQLYLLQCDDVAELLTPSVYLPKYFKLVNNTISVSNELLNITQCFRYFPTGKGVNEVYALCLKNHSVEMTTVTYELHCTKYGGIEYRQLGGGYGTHIDLNSPVIVTHTNYTGPMVLYITNIDGRDWLVVKEIYADGDDRTITLLPPSCAGPHELIQFYQLSALLKCSNGLMYFYDGDNYKFLKLPVQNIAMVGVCDNSSSFVMATNNGYILLNKTASKPLIRIPLLKITSNLVQVNTILSFICQWNGTATNLYFTVRQGDMIYYLSIPLEHASNTSTEARVIFVDHNPPYSFDIIHSSIAGPAWVTKLIDSDHNTQKTVLIDMKTEKQDDHISHGLAYVLSLHSAGSAPDSNVNGGYQDDSRNSHLSFASIVSISGAVGTGVLVMAIITVSIVIVIIKRKCSTSSRRSQQYSRQQSLAEEETTFNDSVQPPTIPGLTARDDAVDQGTTDDQLPGGDNQSTTDSVTTDQQAGLGQFSSTQSLVHATSETIPHQMDNNPVQDEVVTGRRFPVPSGGPMPDMPPPGESVVLSTNDTTDRDDETEV